jgi:hypothetical protein
MNECLGQDWDRHPLMVWSLRGLAWSASRAHGGNGMAAAQGMNP